MRAYQNQREGDEDGRVKFLADRGESGSDSLGLVRSARSYRICGSDGGRTKALVRRPAIGRLLPWKFAISYR